MKTFISLLCLLLVTACGQADPTPQAEDSASAEAINASVEQAENKAEAAEDQAR